MIPITNSPLKTRYSARFIRDTEGFDIPWKRIEDFALLELPRPIVVVNGCFDLLHSSHMRLIFAARKKAATLICAMDSDAHTSRQKGPSRPLQTWPERAATLRYMPIDYLVEFDSEDELQSLLRMVRPDMRIKGEDHIGDKDPSPVPTMFVRGGHMRTSVIIERIVERYGPGDGNLDGK